MSTAPWAGMDPNSRHQLWSRWTFAIRSSRRRDVRWPSEREVLDNARRFFVALFHTEVGRLRCDRKGNLYVIVLEVDGPPAHDPDCQAAVRRQFVRDFLEKGFGVGARLVRYEVGILAGDTQAGRPPAQLVVMPQLVDDDLRAAFQREIRAHG